MISPERVQRARKRLGEMAGDMPSTDGGGGTGGHSDRTGSLAFRHRIRADDPDYGHLADIARRDSDELDRMYTEILRRARLGQPAGNMIIQLDRLLRRWEPLTERQVDALRAETRLIGREGCRSCQRAGQDEDIHARHMCKFCDRLTARVAGRFVWNEDLPPVELIHRHWRGITIDERQIDGVMYGRERRE